MILNNIYVSVFSSRHICACSESYTHMILCTHNMSIHKKRVRFEYKTHSYNMCKKYI